MTGLLRPSTVCFFCRSLLKPPPADPHSFRCPHCDCLNRYDAHGDILSDEPAMHDEALNSESFARRGKHPLFSPFSSVLTRPAASPSTVHLPSIHATSHFCHTCQTNQMLLLNLLSNYLPPPHHPDYPLRLQNIEEYRQSLHLRYPPVCASCIPAVQDEIRKKDNMARTKALAGWLNVSRGNEKRRQVSRPGRNLQTHLFWWSMRGLLWFMTLAASLLSHTAVVLSLGIPDVLRHVLPALPFTILCSLLWTAWDPTYYSCRKARMQGRDLRVRGKKNYVILQMVAWFSRLLSSILLALSWHAPSSEYMRLSPLRTHYYSLMSLVVEVLVCLASFVALRVQKPPPIRLIDTSNHEHTCPTPEMSPRPSPAPHTQTFTEPDLLASLSLSSKPIISPTNPIFGLSSLKPRSSQNNMHEDHDEDAMDWTPTLSPVKQKTLDVNDDGSWLRQQLFFPPERPTGLESLFASTKLDDRDQKYSANANSVHARAFRHPFANRWWWVGAVLAILIPLVALASRLWRGMET